MASILISLLVLSLIPVILSTVIRLFFSIQSKKPWPKPGEWIRDQLLSVGITLGITLGICLCMVWTGLLDSFFFRPSKKNYGEHTRLGLAPEDVFFESRDGTRLHGWFLPAVDQPMATVIHFHGSDRNISFTVRNSHWLLERGFNVFLFDYRGYGKSEGKPSASGLIEDSAAAIEYVRARPDVDAEKLVLWGQSMGGQLAILGTQTAGNRGIRAVIAEATYASRSHQVKDKLAGMGPLWLFQWSAWLVTSDAFSAFKAVGTLAPARIVLVHGLADRVVRPYHSEWLYRDAQEPKDIWRFDRVGHLDVFKDAGNRDRLVAFITGMFDSSVPADSRLTQPQAE